MGPTSAHTSSDSANAALTAMHEVRLVGRGGQGVVTAGDLLGKAAVLEGRYAQSIPTFGPERRGALSQCTVRISDGEILLKCSSTSPGALLILDPSIWHFANITLGLVQGGSLIFNTSQSPAEIDEELRSGKHGYQPAATEFEVLTVDATSIAMEILGRPITYTSMMGAFVGTTGWIGMESVAAALTERFGEKADLNIKAAKAAADRIRRIGD
jgi:2-oxoacid:acceptor oxidoreductase gamma subunit (pyruvate/2-ketoisovalerate family)